MNNKEIQELRMKSYFIDATKKILKGEGLKSVSVRNIAKEAGYSYATLYNYFKDANELVFLCVKDFIREIQQYVKQKSRTVADGNPMLQSIYLAYTGYFIEYPGIFELFFLERIGDLGHKQETIDAIVGAGDLLTLEAWNKAVSLGQQEPRHVELKKQQLNYLIAGMLLHYLNRYSPTNYTLFIENLNKHIEAILLTKSDTVEASAPKEVTRTAMVQNALLTVNIGR